MFNMEPPFPNMDGKKIKVYRASGSNVGELACRLTKAKSQFGVRIDIDRPPVFDPLAEPPRVGEWTTNGSFSCEYLFLTEELIRAIKQSNSPDYAFTLVYD